MNLFISPLISHFPYTNYLQRPFYSPWWYITGGAGDKKAEKAHKKANKYVQGDVLVSVAAFIRDAQKAPRCEQTTCAQCHTEGACYQDSSEAYDADGDGKLQDREQGSYYCEECWVGVYGVPPRKAAAKKESMLAKGRRMSMKGLDMAKGGLKKANAMAKVRHPVPPCIVFNGFIYMAKL